MFKSACAKFMYQLSWPTQLFYNLVICCDSKEPSINVNIFISVQTIHFLPPPKKVHQHFLSAKNPHENNKNQAKKLKVYRKNVDFHRPPLPLPQKVYCL